MVRGGSCEPQGMVPPARAHPAALMEGAGQSGSGSKVQQVHGSWRRSGVRLGNQVMGQAGAVHQKGPQPRWAWPWCSCNGDWLGLKEPGPELKTWSCVNGRKERPHWALPTFSLGPAAVSQDPGMRQRLSSSISAEQKGYCVFLYHKLQFWGLSLQVSPFARSGSQEQLYLLRGHVPSEFASCKGF